MQQYLIGGVQKKKKTQKAIRIQNNGRSKEFISQYKKTMGFNQKTL